MVKELCKDETTFFVCGVCSFVYQERELADECQLWCEGGSWNPEIAKHAVGVDDNGEISQLNRWKEKQANEYRLGTMGH